MRTGGGEEKGPVAVVAVAVVVRKLAYHEDVRSDRQSVKLQRESPFSRQITFQC